MYIAQRLEVVVAVLRIFFDGFRRLEQFALLVVVVGHNCSLELRH